MKWYIPKDKLTYEIVDDKVLCKRDDEISLRPSGFSSEALLRFLEAHPRLWYRLVDVGLENK